MTYGTGPFGQFGAGLTVITASADRGTIPSSRSIDEQGRLVQTGDDAGSFRGMSDTRQRVYILCCLVREPTKQTADFEATIRTRIRDALTPLTAGPSPVIKLRDVVVERFDTGTKKTVRFVDLLSGQADEVEI